MSYLNPGQNAEWFEAGDDLPAVAAERIPVSLQQAMTGGNAEFFAELRTDLPLCHQALAACPPVQLLHLTVKRFSMSGKEKQDHLFYWVVQMRDKALEIHIPAREPDSDARLKHLSGYLPALPAALQSFYRDKDGMGLTPDYGQPRRDFPKRVSDWLPVLQYARDRGFDPLAAQEQSERFAMTDAHVCIELRDDRVIVVDLAGKPGGMAVLNLLEPESSIALRDPAAELDAYFAAALKAPWGQLDWSWG